MSSKQEIARFQEAVWAYYARAGRHDLPWRQPLADGSFDPYRIMVSEIMLQQTQVQRVIPKYEVFLQVFPTVNELAVAPLGSVLRQWSGLGYNRRAKFLHQAAGQISQLGHFPETQAALTALPGIGKNTAGAIQAYAFNQLAVFIETNVRTAVIHHFFADRQDVPDREVAEIVAQALDREQPREWYWALMDYGSHLKQTVGNLNRQSQMYAKQSAFAGSRRQLRGLIIRALGERPHSLADLQRLSADERLPAVIEDLVAEGLVRRQGDRFHL